MSEDGNENGIATQNRGTRIVKSRWRVRVILLLVSITLTFLVTDEISFGTLVKSLFVFLPSMLILGFGEALKSTLADYRKHKRWEELLVVVLLAIGIGFFLLLIVLFLRSVMMAPR